MAGWGWRAQAGREALLHTVTRRPGFFHPVALLSSGGLSSPSWSELGHRLVRIPAQREWGRAGMEGNTFSHKQVMQKLHTLVLLLFHP